MKKWLVLTPEFPPYKGGVGNLALSWAEALSLNAQVTVLTNQENAFVNNEKISVTHIGFSRMWPHWWPFMRFLVQKRQTYKYNSILCLAILPFGTVCFFLKKITGISYVVYVHGMDLAIHKNHYWKKVLLFKILKNSSLVLCNSNYTKELALQFGAQNAKTAVCHPTAHITPSLQSHKPNEYILSLLAGNPFFLSVGRLVKRKNFPRLIEAFALLHNKFPGAKLVIIGKGPELIHIQKIIELHGFQQAVILATECSDEELVWYYQQAFCICFVPTSLNGDVEGFGISAIEAGSFEKPVIASNQGGVPDAIAHNSSGICINPESTDEISNAMIGLLTNKDRARRIGLEGKKRYESLFSFDAFVKQTQAILLTDYKKNISVIIPVYNNATTIVDCLHSIYYQTIQPKEILVIDDGSTDASAERIKESGIPCTYKKISHSGAPVARNTGAQMATGDYVLFLDADAICSSYMLEYMLRALIIHPEASFAYSSFRLGHKKFPSYEYNKDLLQKFNYIHTSSLIRKNVLPKFDEALQRHQDWDLWLTLAEKDCSGIRIPQVLYKLQKKRGNISSWIPAFIYKLPGSQLLPQIKKYQMHADIIRAKHHLT